MKRMHRDVVRGRPPRTLLTFGGVVGVVMALMAVWVWFGEGPRGRRLAGVLLIGTLTVVATLAMTLLAAVSSARVEGGVLRFRCGGVPLRAIPLAAVTGFERLAGRGSAVRILYGSSWYCPNGTLDPDEVVELLRAHSVAERADEGRA